jgi:hypothetical protein
MPQSKVEPQYFVKGKRGSLDDYITIRIFVFKKEIIT